MDLLVYAALGRLCIWTLQIAGPVQFVRRKRILHELLECDLCLGMWVYFGLAIIWDMRIFALAAHPFDYALTALATSFIVHLTRLGWDAKFGKGLQL